MSFYEQLLIGGAFAFTGGMLCLIVSMALAKGVHEFAEDFCSDGTAGAIGGIAFFVMIIGGPAGIAWLDGATDAFAYKIAACCSLGALAFIGLGLLYDWATTPAYLRARSSSDSHQPTPRDYGDECYGFSPDYPEQRYDDYRYAGEHGGSGYGAC